MKSGSSAIRLTDVVESPESSTDYSGLDNQGHYTLGQTYSGQSTSSQNIPNQPIPQYAERSVSEYSNLRGSPISRSGSPLQVELDRSEPQRKVKADLCRLARFGANLCDAHSCFIFLPMETLSRLTCTPGSDDSQIARYLILAGSHSLSGDVVTNCVLPKGSGLIGWVAKNNRSIHVSPFELDSRTLGIYSKAHELKSFIGAPVSLRGPSGETSIGVIACDSKKSFAFSKLQGKLLEDLSREISNVLELLNLYGAQTQCDVAWRTFLRKSEDLITSLGPQSIEVLRLKTLNFDQLEVTLGTSACLMHMEQVYRLVQQALPQQFAVTKLINGDILICLDNMMSSFYENKIRAICDHIAPHGKRPHFEFLRASFKTRRDRATSIEALVRSTIPVNDAEEVVVLLSKEIENGYRRS